MVVPGAFSSWDAADRREESQFAMNWGKQFVIVV